MNEQEMLTLKIAVCYKWVLDEADIVVDQENNALDIKRAKYKISEIDRNALTLGVDLKTNDGILLGLTVGPNVKSSVKDVLSRGADKAFFIESDELESSAAAKVLAAAIKKIGDIDLVICGEGSSDQYSQQVGPRIAALLDWNLVTYASDVKAEGNKLTAIRKLEDEVETIAVNVPAVLTVVSEINQPKVPGMKQILAARKKPSETVKIEELNMEKNALKTPVKVMDIGPAVMERRQIQLNKGDVSIPQAAEKLVGLLRKDKVI